MARDFRAPRRPRRRRRGLARDVCVALQNWGTARGATRSYVQVLVENAAAIALYESLGYRLHHHLRYVDARALAAVVCSACASRPGT